MKNLVVVLMGGLSGEREISFLTGKACSKALKRKGYKVFDLDAKGYFVEELRKLKPKVEFKNITMPIIPAIWWGGMDIISRGVLVFMTLSPL